MPSFDYPWHASSKLSESSPTSMNNEPREPNFSPSFASASCPRHTKATRGHDKQQVAFTRTSRRILHLGAPSDFSQFVKRMLCSIRGSHTLHGAIPTPRPRPRTFGRTIPSRFNAKHFLAHADSPILRVTGVRVRMPHNEVNASLEPSSDSGSLP